MSGGVASLRSAAWSERAAVVAIFLANGIGIGAWAASIPALKARLALSDGALGLSCSPSPSARGWRCNSRRV